MRLQLNKFSHTQYFERKVEMRSLLFILLAGCFTVQGCGVLVTKAQKHEGVKQNDAKLLRIAQQGVERLSTEENKALIKQHKIALGMNILEVTAAWGVPLKKESEITTPRGVVQHWYFRSKLNGRCYLCRFEDSFLVATGVMPIEFNPYLR